MTVRGLTQDASKSVLPPIRLTSLQGSGLTGSFAWVIEDLILDVLSAGNGPDELARNIVESSRDWRNPPARRRRQGER